MPSQSQPRRSTRSTAGRSKDAQTLQKALKTAKAADKAAKQKGEWLLLLSILSRSQRRCSSERAQTKKRERKLQRIHEARYQARLDGDLDDDELREVDSDDDDEGEEDDRDADDDDKAEEDDRGADDDDKVEEEEEDRGADDGDEPYQDDRGADYGDEAKEDDRDTDNGGAEEDLDDFDTIEQAELADDPFADEDDDRSVIHDYERYMSDYWVVDEDGNIIDELTHNKRPSRDFDGGDEEMEVGTKKRRTNANIPQVRIRIVFATLHLHSLLLLSDHTRPLSTHLQHPATSTPPSEHIDKRPVSPASHPHQPPTSS